MNNKYNCGCGKPHNKCGCQEIEYIGCPTKLDLACSTYTGVPLTTIEVEAGLDGNSVIKAINDYLEDLPGLEDQQVLIESVGNAIPVYKGINPINFIHEIKSIRGIEGIIVRDKAETDCDNQGNEIEVLIDTDWLTNFLNQWITTVDICQLIEGCTTPPSNNPVTTNINKSIINRGYANFNASDFLTHFSDVDGNALTSVKISGVVNGFTLDGIQITSGQEFTMSQITSGILRYNGDDVNNAYVKIVNYTAKDSSGATSNMSDIIISVGAKTFIVFSTPTVSLIRETTNTKSATISYTNGTGQNIPNGYVFISQGTVGQPGYLLVTSTSQVTTTGSGTIPVQVVSIPTATQANQTVNYNTTFDGSNGSVSFTYSSIPVTNNDITKSTAFLQVVPFANVDFTSNSYDFDGDITDVRILPITTAGVTATLDGYKYNGVAYTGQWISIANALNITYDPDNNTAGYTKRNKWQVRDSVGNVSL